MIADREIERGFLDVVGRLVEQRDGPAAYALGDGIGKKLHDPRQVDLDAHSVVEHLDATGDSLPHSRPGTMQGVVLPVVIEPAEDDAELGRQARDAGI